MKNVLKFSGILLLKTIEIGCPIFLFALAYTSYSAERTEWASQAATGVILLVLYWFKWAMGRARDEFVENCEGVIERTWACVERQDTIIKLQEATIKNYKEYIDQKNL